MIGSDKGFNAGNHQSPMAEINTTPLVDVMLVLLVIFIITAPLLTHAVKIDLPKASSTLLIEKPEVISLSIDAAGQMYWNDVLVSPDALTQKFAEASKQNPQPEFHIRADKETRYQVLTEVMAGAQNAGLQKLGFVSVPK